MTPSSEPNREKAPAPISPRASRAIAVAFALLIVGAIFIALSMLVVWGLVWLGNLLFT
jgi:capsular polysaccharide biosynthesis protein